MAAAVRFTVVLLTLSLPAASSFAGDAGDACEYLKRQVDRLEGRIAAMVDEMTAAEAERNATLSKLPFDPGDRSAAAVADWLRTEATRAQRDAYGAYQVATLRLTLAAQDVLGLLEQIEAFEIAADLICLQGDTSAGIGGASTGSGVVPPGSTVIQDLSDGGDEIIYIPPGSGGGTAGGDPFILDDLHPGDGTNAWEILMELEGTTETLASGDMRMNQHHSFRMTVGDNGALYQAAAYDRSLGVGCDMAGNISLSGNRVKITFTGSTSGGAIYREVELTADLVREADGRKRYPLTFVEGEWRTFQRNPDGRYGHTHTGTPLAVRKKGASHMYRTRLGADQLAGKDYCGDGVP